MRQLAVLACVALAACQHQPTVVTGGVDTVTVDVPIVQSCIDLAQIEPIPPSAMPVHGSDVDALASGAYVDAVRYRELARKQNEQLRACAKLTERKPQ